MKKARFVQFKEEKKGRHRENEQKQHFHMHKHFEPENEFQRKVDLTWVGPSSNIFLLEL